MTDKERRVSKYLPFDALKGLKESICECDNSVFMASMPELSEEQKDKMDYVIFKCYSEKKIIDLFYYENGFINVYSGVIDKIDLLQKKICLIPKKYFKVDYIVDVFPKE